MKKIILTLLSITFIYSQCDYNNESLCLANENCQWISDINQMNCSNFSNSSSCENYSEYGCSWEFSWGGWQDYGSSCTGGTFQIDNGYCEEFPMPECSEMVELECIDNDNCEWIEDIEYGNCSQLGEDACDANPNCNYDCEMYHGSCAGCCWGSCLGGNYEINNSFCEENLTEPVDCSELNESLCSDDNYAEECEWVENTTNINCNSLSDNQCTSYNDQLVNSSQGCWLQQGECLQWGSWYTWMCYEYDYQCVGGIIQVDTSYCEETISGNPGDMNYDGIINIQDIIQIIHLILNADYNSIGDINDDHLLNVLDVIIIVNIILDN